MCCASHIFLQASAPVPVITAEVTSTIEDLIKQRIKSEAWDDVVRKVPDDDFTEKDLPEVSQDKSKAGACSLLFLFVFFRGRRLSFTHT